MTTEEDTFGLRNYHYASGNDRHLLFPADPAGEQKEESGQRDARQPEGGG
jgi:hypothetical protein